jgi:CRP/FNR family transcriptional regulator, cyclic AMP receptor protein
LNREAFHPMVAEKKHSMLINAKEIKAILNKIAIFGGFSRKQLDSFLRLLKCITYKKDEFIFKQGDEPTHIYIIRSGEVRIVVNVETEALVIADFREGDCFGETAVIGIQPHSASALAIKDTELIVITAEALLSIYKSDKELFGKLILNIAREACRRLHKADKVLLHYVHNNKSR